MYSDGTFSNFESVMMQISEKLSSVVNEHGQEVVNFVLLYARVESISAIILFLFLSVVLFLSFRHLTNLYSSYLMKKGELSALECWNIFLTFLLGFSCIIGVAHQFFLFVYGLVGVFYPEFWIAARLLNGVI